jgi:hypothetical protein
MDMDIYNLIVKKHNINEAVATQACADEDADVKHLFGPDTPKLVDYFDPSIIYSFTSVFGPTTLGMEIKKDGRTAQLMYDMIHFGSTARGILQFAGKPDLGPDQYGRLRPGCSEKQEAKKKSNTDDRLNVLANFTINDADGNKETYTENGVEKYYYDENGNWTSKTVKSPEEFEEVAKNSLYANSYPSGHSSGIWSGTMSLIEAMPKKADLLMQCGNRFSMHRTVARYHWNSDTIQGRVLATTINPVVHSCTDYDSRMKKVKKELGTLS